MAEIILMEDSEPLRRVLMEELRDAGHNVTTFPDGSETRNAQLFEYADILITDLWMPNVSGIEAIRNLRESYPDLPVIVITGKPPHVLESLKVTSVMQKPLNGADLVSLVNTISQAA